MSKLRKVGDFINKTSADTQQNTRRVSSKFPFIERKLDKISGQGSYIMDFEATPRDHSVLLSLYIRPENCCECEPGQTPDAGRDGVASHPSYVGGADGIAHPAIWHTFAQTGHNINLGYGSPFFYPFYTFYSDYANYSNDTTNGGITVPVDGIYTISYTEFVGNHPANPAGYAIVSIRRNGVVITQRSYTPEHGLTDSGGIQMLIYANCIPLWQGDIVDGYFQGENVGIAVDPDQTQGSLTINLIGLGWGALTGTVRDTVTGLPIEGVTVSYPQGWGGSTITDEYGVYLFDQLRPNTYSITAHKTGYIDRTMTATVTFGEITTMDIPLQPV